MEHAKKMILVPSDVMERFLNKQESEHISRIDEEMSNLLHAKNIPDNDKWDMYRAALLKYLGHTERQKKPSYLPIVDTPISIEPHNSDQSKTVQVDEILSSVPQTFRRKAQLLSDRILRSGKITWDAQGVVSIDGRAIPRSNITDLINDVIRPR